jgi:DNA ligase-3
VQVHKKGAIFNFYSRSLKPVTEHKVRFFQEVIKLSCPHGDTMILDAEVLMVDKKTSKPLPFGTLGVHKKSGPCCGDDQLQN